MGKLCQKNPPLRPNVKKKQFFKRVILRDIKYIGCLCSHVKENIINLGGEGVWHEVSTRGEVTGQWMLCGNNKQPRFLDRTLDRKHQIIGQWTNRLMNNISLLMVLSRKLHQRHRKTWGCGGCNVPLRENLSWFWNLVENLAMRIKSRGWWAKRVQIRS